MRSLILAPLLFALGCAVPADREDEAAGAAVTDPIVHPSTRDAVRYDRDRVLDGRAEVRVTVKSLGYRKSVGIRASLDGGPWSDWPGAFDRALGGSEESWLVRVPRSFGRLEYAIFYRDDETSAVHWDNNGGRNFLLDAGALVHRVGDSVDAGRLTIDLEVKNVAYEKSCWATATSNGWLTSTMPAARYVGEGDRAGFERFRIEVELSKAGVTGALASDAAAYEYAVVCRAGGAQATEGWDNNRGQNHRWERVAPPVVAFSIPFDGAQRLALAPTGAAFVASGDRWVSGFAADGRRLFAVDVGARIDDLLWSDAAGLIVRAEGRFRALGPDGATRWTTEQDYQLVLAQTVDGEYLVGPRGGALLGAATPALLAPPGGCSIGEHPNETYPALGVGGVMFCRSGEGVFRVDLRKRTVGPRLAVAGFPWAASADAFVAVAADRSSLRGYRHDGALLWSKDGLRVAGDTAYGYGQACPTHAWGDLAVVFQTPTAWSPDGTYYAGLELSTGAERFRTSTSDVGYGPCARRDGRFYAQHSPYKYGTTVDRVGPDGSVQPLTIGVGAQLLGFAADGKVARRSWAYYPNDRGRLVVNDGAGNEVFARTYFSADSAAHGVVTAGARVLVMEPGKVTALRFD